MKQVQDLEKKHKESGEVLRGDEFLSGIKKEDRLVPVITTVLYCGTEWDGCQSLYELLDLEKAPESVQGLKEYLPDYRMNLVDVRKLENTEVFESSLQYIFSMVKYNKDKQLFYDYLNSHREEIQRMDHVEQMMALSLLGEQKRLLQVMDGEKGEKSGVCKAIDDLIEDGRREGKAESVLVLLEAIEAVPKDLYSKIQKETNVSVLERWLKLAAKAESLAQFQKEM